MTTKFNLNQEYYVTRHIQHTEDLCSTHCYSFHNVIRNYTETIFSRFNNPLIHLSIRLTEEGVTETNADSLGLSVVGKRVLAELTADTGLLVATEGHLVVEGVVSVDPDGTRPEGVGDLDGGVEVLGVNGGGKTVCAGVAELDGILLGLELGDRADGAEDLLFHNLHVLCDVGEDRGLDEVALVTLALATGLNGGTGILAGLDVPEE
jgi:hypothetical protein